MTVTHSLDHLPKLRCPGDSGVIEEGEAERTGIEKEERVDHCRERAIYRMLLLVETKQQQDTSPISLFQAQCWKQGHRHMTLCMPLS